MVVSTVDHNDCVMGTLWQIQDNDEMLAPCSLSSQATASPSNGKQP